VRIGVLYQGAGMSIAFFRNRDGQAVKVSASATSIAHANDGKSDVLPMPGNPHTVPHIIKAPIAEPRY